LSRDYGLEAQQAAEAHIEACFDALDHEGEPGAEEQIPFPETLGPFCGCTTCIVRETLWKAWPILEEAARE
jgi:hypothetical protein